MSERLRVDPVRCDAFGYCAELLPELVTLDEWGYPILDGAPVPAGLVELARLAVRQCPRRALFLEQVPDPAPPRAMRRPRAPRVTTARHAGPTRR